MRRTIWTPSIVPNGDDQTIYLVIDDFGRNGRAYRKSDAETADLQTVILDLLDGQYNNPRSRRRLQYVRGLVAGRLRGYRPRATSPLRPATA